VDDLSLDAHLLDIHALVKRLGLSEFSIFAASYAGPIALRYAARNPEMVSNLLLWCTHASHREVTDRLPGPNNLQREAINRLASIDWDLFIRTYLHRAIGWTEGDLANQFANLAKNSIEPAQFFDSLMEYAAFDATSDLPAVSSPTLVLHRPGFVGSDVEVAKGLASRIPDAASPSLKATPSCRSSAIPNPSSTPWATSFAAMPSRANLCGAPRARLWSAAAEASARSSSPISNATQSSCSASAIRRVATSCAPTNASPATACAASTAMR